MLNNQSLRYIISSYQNEITMTVIIYHCYRVLLLSVFYNDVDIATAILILPLFNIALLLSMYILSKVGFPTPLSCYTLQYDIVLCVCS